VRALRPGGRHRPFRGFKDLAGNDNAERPGDLLHDRQRAGLVNAPIAPEALYVGRVGAEPSLSVVDLDGFGFGTGDPAWDPACAWKEGNSNARNDPNVLFMSPKLIPR
jgi:hypothetical protein